jgi:hypothetical protein
VAAEQDGSDAAVHAPTVEVMSLPL